VTNFTATTPATCTLASASECKKYASLAAGTTRMRYGRVQLQNVYGSERLALPLPMALQYWNSNWITNPLDTCTVIVANQFAWDFLPAGTSGRLNNLAACNSALSVTGAAPNYTVSLSAPVAGRSGWSGIILNLDGSAPGNQCVAVGGAGGAAATASAPWLRFNWRGSGRVNPSARATFGVYRSPLVYRRENY
jgi:MSHA biogenesis protein MshQ